jgi:hypothetical protein
MTEGQKPISRDAIKALLATTRSRVKVDPTETRDITTWFQLNHHSREEGCENPDCTDPRKPDDRGRKIVVSVKGQMMCRFCFLAGWLKEIDGQS